MGEASRRAEPWETTDHGSDYAGVRRRGDTFNGKGYVGQVGAFNALIAQLNEDQRPLRVINLALREGPRPRHR
jgi:hypothetical protein